MSPTAKAAVFALACVTSLLTVAATSAEAQPNGNSTTSWYGSYHGTYRVRPAQPRVGVFFVPRGLYVGAGVVGTKIVRQSGGPELLGDGAGLTLFSGLRLSRSLALELGWAGTAHNPETVDVGFGPETDYLVLNAFTADARVYLGGGGAAPIQGGQGGQARVAGAQPFLQGGLGVYFLDSQAFGTQSVGTGFQLGGGISFALGPRAELGLRALYRGIAMGPPASNQDDTFISAVALDAAISLRF